MTRREEYSAYLRSPKWRAFRQTILKVRGKKCEFCLKPQKKPHVHHATYIRFGNEIPKDVVVLCRRCHRLVHKVHAANKYKNLWFCTFQVKRFMKKQLTKSKKVV